MVSHAGGSAAAAAGKYISLHDLCRVVLSDKRPQQIEASKHYSLQPRLRVTRSIHQVMQLARMHLSSRIKANEGRATKSTDVQKEQAFAFTAASHEIDIVSCVDPCVFCRGFGFLK